MAALRQSFASSSRLTLHHLPPRPTLLFPRYAGSLAQASTQPSGFEGIPSAAYSGSVAQSSSRSSPSSSSIKGKSALSENELHSAPPPLSSSNSSKKVGPLLEPSPAPKAKSVIGSRRPELKSKKNAITMTPAAVSRLQALLASPTEPRLLRISVKSRGCAGMAYHLDYVPPPGGRFDEVVEQDGVKVLIDSKALFSIIGSRMDWRDNRLSAGFVFDK
ncbi:iron-sulfur cluster assembly protein [Kwoniella heveanensis CBS 569]|uniref:Iron-sulfur cluster assembly protein n=1 Tax=Kwoniella heveanensis BCC8398 TaxID=1296120 RepID=A0A1B9H3N1_9TREE|nr:iron-sulfur cluster assembly protein [Kwoniella heveanensis BCC8398]OCF42722.1 iron-sulfur cluster assembly protein [Kwoniella heveanensis CBS 569]